MKGNVTENQTVLKSKGDKLITMKGVYLGKDWNDWFIHKQKELGLQKLF